MSSNVPRRIIKSEYEEIAVINRSLSSSRASDVSLGGEEAIVVDYISDYDDVSSPDEQDRDMDSPESGPSDSPAQPQPSTTYRRSQPTDLKCQYCPKRYRNGHELETHMEYCQNSRPHECGVCGKRFKTRSGLQQHHRIHTQERPYGCQYCEKRFTQKSHVDQHERIHTGEKPFVCGICNRAFRQRSQQQQHEATHSKD